MKLKEIAGHGVGNVISVDENDSIRDAARLMAEEEVGVVIVNGRGRATGVFSERDMARAVADEADLDSILVRDYMTDSPVTADEDAYIGDAVAKMNEFGLRHVIVTKDEEVVGMVSIRAILRLYGTRWPEL